MKAITEINSGLTLETIKKINSVFQNYSQIQTVVLYGSRAKGSFHLGSDIDLTIITDRRSNSTLSFSELLKIEDELDDLFLPYTIDLSVKHQIENSHLVEHIERVGVIFFSRQ